MSVVATTSRDGGRFHEPGCHFAGRARPENRVTLDSPDAAEDEGYCPCTFCFPDRRAGEGPAVGRPHLDVSEGSGGGKGGGPHESGAVAEGHFDFQPREPGVWAERYLMPDGSRPVVAIDEDGILRGVYHMRPGDDPRYVITYMEGLLGRSHRKGLHIVD